MDTRPRPSGDGARPPDRASFRPDRARGRRARRGGGPRRARRGDPRDAVPARAHRPPAPRGAAPAGGRPGADRHDYRPRRTYDSKELTVNSSATPVSTALEMDPEAVDQLIARVLS